MKTQSTHEVTSKIYDYPERSSRGRVITQAFLVHLAPSRIFPEVRANRESKKAEWVEISKLREDQFFEDHYHIIQDMLTQLNKH